jgi:subtilase family serine protease
VAIVDAFDDPNAASDLAAYRSFFGLSALNTTGAPTFTQVKIGSPRSDGGWAQEISLDVDMVSAICPNCNILLVEANSNTYSDLMTAVDYATAHANYVSNSYGSGEFSTEGSLDSHFNLPGKAITFSSGDGGYGVEYPAASPYVTAVGGTSLNFSSGVRVSETAWSGAGSGCSAVEQQPSWQGSVANITNYCHRRAVADVSAVADPNTGVSVYDTWCDAYGCGTGWMVFGGTSVASPIVASVYALAGNATLLGFGSYPYSHTTSLFDITSGRNGRCRRAPTLCNAGPGWDGPTGLGTPNGTGSF